MARLKALSDQAQGVPRNMTVGRYKLDMDVFNFENEGKHIGIIRNKYFQTSRNDNIDQIKNSMVPL